MDYYEDSDDEGYPFDDVKMIHMTKKDDGEPLASLLVFTDSDAEGPFEEETWVPYSVIHDDSAVSRVGDEGTVLLKEWWVVEKGWD